MIVELNKISKYYEVPGSGAFRTILDEISFNIQKGDSKAIVGPSGTGKSTLLNIMGTLDVPSSGIVTINGTETISLKEAELAKIRNRHIGFVFQVHHLLPQLNMIENVLLPTIPLQSRKETAFHSRAMDLLDFVGLADKIHQRPGQLSVGECQRVAVVRALINKPELILADEPTGSLDQESAKQIGKLLSKINAEQNIAMVIVTHSEELAKNMKEIFHLSNGKLFIRKSDS
jgi:ABC-type lipoprotein export system ATPase subunit